MSSRTSFMNSLNEARSESTFPFHVPKAKAAPATIDSSDKYATQATGLASHSFTMETPYPPVVLAAFGESST